MWLGVVVCMAVAFDIRIENLLGGQEGSEAQVVWYLALATVSDR